MLSPDRLGCVFFLSHGFFAASLLVHLPVTQLCSSFKVIVGWIVGGSRVSLLFLVFRPCSVWRGPIQHIGQRGDGRQLGGQLGTSERSRAPVSRDLHCADCS